MCILPYLEIDLGLEIPSIKRNNRLNNRLLYLFSFSTWNPKTRPRTAIAANILLFHLRGLQGSHYQTIEVLHVSFS